MATHGDDSHNARRKFITRSATLVAAGAAGAVLPALPTLARNLSDEDALEVAAIAAGTCPITLYRRPNLQGAQGSSALADFRTAITAMMALPPEDPRNWYRQAMIHVLDCPHGNAWFFSWHRAYLYYFERIVRKFSNNPRFELPYWDWTVTPEMPAAFFRGDVLDTRAPGYIHDFPTFDRTFRGPMQAYWGRLTALQKQQLQLRGLADFDVFWAAMQQYFTRGTTRLLSADNRQFTGATLQAVSYPTMVNAMSSSDFTVFGGSMVPNHSDMTGVPGMVEAQPHNLVHDAIGGYMGDFFAAVDPVFWLHHANVDRLWDVWWLELGGVMTPMQSSMPWIMENFTFFCDENGNPVAPNLMLNANYTWSSSLLYDYQPSAPLATAPSRPANATWPTAFPMQLQSTTLAINGSVTSVVDPGADACNAFDQDYQTAILIDMDRPMDQSAWRFNFEIQIEGSSFSAKPCGSTAFFGTMGMADPNMSQRCQLKLGIASGMRQCLDEAGGGAHRFAITVRAEPVGSTLPTQILNIYSVTLVSL